MNQKLIMENWRRFLNEQEERGIRLPDDQVCMRVEMETGENAQFTMYTPGISESIEERILGLRIIGSVNLENMDESGPCLTGNGKRPSWHVLSIHTNSAFRRVGYGAMLYGFAFLIASMNDAGLTSDKYSGSKSDAKEKWNSFSNNSNTFSKVVTSAGNDTFDYEGKTPDPMDDCDVEDLGADNGSDHSISHKNPSIYEQSIQVYEANHLDFEEEIIESGFMSHKEFDKFLTQADFKSFEESYDEAG